MNTQKNLNINLSSILGLSLLRKHINKKKEITDISVENMIQSYKEIELEIKKFASIKKAKIASQTIIELSDKIVNINKSQLNLLNKADKESQTQFIFGIRVLGVV